ncbi:MAG: hypothetical protein AMXMBFR49_12190 [Chlorobiota bacterium]
MIYSRLKRSLQIFLLATIGLFAQNGGNGLNFDGVDDFIRTTAGAGSTLDFSGASDFTVSFWLYPDNPVSATTQHLFHKQHNFFSTAHYALWLVDGKLNARIDRFNDGGNYFIMGVDPVITQTRWYYISLVKSGSDFIIYVDGVAYVSGTIPAQQLGAIASTRDIYFGRHGDGGENFDGKMDEIKIWNAGRSETDIRRDMHLQGNNSTPGLIYYLSLNEGTGQSPADGGFAPANTTTLGDLNTAEASDPSWVVSGSMAGPGKALRLDGIDEKGTASGLNLNTTDLTVEFWAKVNGGSTQRLVLGQGSLSTNNYLQVGFRSPTAPNNPNGFFMGFFNNDISAPVGATDTEWHHYAATYNRTTGERKLYRNGVLVAQNTATGALGSSGTLHIGSSIVNTEFFPGDLDELRIWLSVRTQEEIVANMNKSMEANESGLYAYYRFDNAPDASQTQVSNLSSNTFHIALANVEGASDFVTSNAFHTWIGGADNQSINPSNWSTGLTPSNNDNVEFGLLTSLATPANVMSTSVFRNATFTSSGTTFGGSLGVLGNLGLATPLDFGGNMVSVSLAGRLTETGSNLASNGDFLSSRVINAPNNDNIAGFGATLTSAVNLGTTLVTRSHTARTIGAFTGIKRSYDFAPNTNTGLNASLVFSYDDSELNGNSEGALRLIKSTNNGTSWALVTATHNAVANTFSVTGQNSLGLYTAFAYSTPTINLTAPANAAITQSLTPTLTWSFTGGVSPFTSTVEIATDAGFTNIVHSASAGTNVTYNVPAGNLVNNTRYWWRIVATDGVAGVTTSSSRTFTTILATPALASPATEYESPVMSPDLSWTMDNRKSNVFYKLLVNTAPGLNAGAHTNATSGINPGTLTLNPTGLAVATKYWWTVQAEVNDGTADNNGEFKVAAPERTFYTPLDVLNKPYNGVTGLSLEPHFTWDDVLFETGYELRISTAGGSQAAFDGAVIFTDLNIPANTDSLAYNENTLNEGLLGPQYPFPLDPNTRYYWQLVAKDGSVAIKSPIWHFTTYPAVTVSQYNPGDGDTVYLNSLMFTYGINQATAGLKFKLQVKAGSVAPVKTDWLTSNFTGVSPDLFQTVNLLGGTKYWWRIVLLNDANEVMAYSATQSFTTSGGATVPYPSWPVGDPLVYTNAPMLHWYTAGYSPDVTFDVVLSGDTTAVGYAYVATHITDIYHQISINQNPGTRYFWAVRSVYKRGTPDEVISNFSFWQSFRTNGAGTLVVPNPSYPTDNLLVYTTAPYFYWWLGQDGTGLTYQFEYATNSGFSSSTTISNIPDLYTQISGLVPGQTYFWRVRSYNGSAYSGWSDTVSFSVAGGVSNGYTVLNWPTGNPTVYSTMPTLSWYLEGSPMGITGYVVRWKVGSNSTNWNTDYDSSRTVTDVYNTFYTFTSPFDEGEIVYWAVAASDGSTLSPWAADTFTIYSGTTPGAPVISWPSGNTVVYSVDPQLSWWVNGSTSGIVGYQVVYSYSDVFFPAATTTLYTTDTWVNASNLVQGATYFWKVRAHFGGGSYGAFSAVDTFTVNPGSFNPVTPIVGGPHNVMIMTTSPVVSWALPAAPPAGITYELEVADNQDFTGAMLFENLTMARQSLQGLAANKSYFWRVRTKTSDGNYSFYSTMGRFRTADGATDIKEVVELPKEFTLSQNWPNPFNPTTMIRFAVPADVNVKLDVYNTLGEKVAELINGPMTAGTYDVPFNASSLPSGIYFYRIEAGSNVAIRKMILMK